MPDLPEDTGELTADQQVTILWSAVNMLLADRRWRGWQVLLSVAGYVLTLVLAVAVAQHFNDTTQHKFCAVVAASTAQGAPPPTTERGRNVAQAMHNLAIELGCKR